MFNIVVFIKLWTQIDRCFKLLAPGELTLGQQILHELLVCFIFGMLLVFIVNNLNNAHLFAAKLDAFRHWTFQNDLEKAGRLLQIETIFCDDTIRSFIWRSVCGERVFILFNFDLVQTFGLIGVWVVFTLYLFFLRSL